ncbi:MAG: phage tail tape measure protein, partial [Ramlibacter sp.]|nr:phage tail tape measure protein [Ramlibacter sp.]
AALGSTFLSLGAGAEVAASASNAMVRELSVATMQSKRFQAGMDAIGLRSEDIEKAMATDAMGTIQMVLNRVKELNAEDQMRVTTQLFGKEYGDDAGKLANNLEELQRQIDLARSKEGSGSMAKEAGARNDTLEAQKLMAQNRLFETASRLGETLAPILTQIYMRVGNIMNAVNDWIQANPELASRIMKVAAAASVLLMGIGGLLAAVAAIMAPLAMLRYGFAVLGIQGVTLGGMLAKVIGVLRMLAMAAMAHPLIAVAALIAAAAVYIWANWETLGPKLIGLWNRISSYIRTVVSNITTWFAGLPAALREMGAQMIDGLINGITSRLAALRETIVGAASKAAAWFKQKMDINSPSRVFHQFGVYTMQGLAQGIQSSDNEPIRAMSAMARNIMSIPLDRRPPIGAGRGLGPTAAMQGAAAGAAAAGAGGIVIHVHAAPGMDERALASLVGQEFERRTRAAAARRRSSYQDAD